MLWGSLKFKAMLNLLCLVRQSSGRWFPKNCYKVKFWWCNLWGIWEVIIEALVHDSLGNVGATLSEQNWKDGDWDGVKTLVAQKVPVLAQELGLQSVLVKGYS